MFGGPRLPNVGGVRNNRMCFPVPPGDETSRCAPVRGCRTPGSRPRSDSGRARDIDEGVRRRLVSVLINLRRADQCLDQEPDRARELIREALRFADMREITAAVPPAALTTDGLAAAVSSLAQTSTLALTLDISGARCPRTVEAAAYVLIAEALAIVSTRSDASRLHVAAYRAGTDLVVEMCDDGVVRGQPTEGSALGGLRRHVDAAGATLQILTQPGIGTRLRATFPGAHEVRP